MPEITVSDNLYRQLVDACGGTTDSLDATMWRMLGEYQRAHQPGD